MRLTISAAARLFGIHRATLHRHINSGRLSCVVQPDGGRALDLSELIRCYGEPPNAPEPMRQAATPDATGGDAADATGATPADNALLLEELRRQTTVIERMAERIERLEEAMRRLPAPSPADTPAPANANATPSPSPREAEEGAPEEPGEDHQPQRPAPREGGGVVSFEEIERRLAERLGRHL